MKRFRFKQEKLLQLKRQLRRQAELKLWQAQSRVNHAEQDVAGLQRELNQMSTAWPVVQGARAEWSWCKGAGALQAAILRARQALQELMHERDEAHAEYKRKDQEYEALRHLREKDWNDHRADIVLVRQQDLDESALRKWLSDSQVLSEDRDHD